MTRILLLLSTSICLASSFAVYNDDSDALALNYCNDSILMEEAGLMQSALGHFLGFACSAEFFHCRWQSDGFRTYRKQCGVGLVFDTVGTQNCNYDYNVKSCGLSGKGPKTCNGTDFHCPLSEECLPMHKRCDGHYDCALEEDEQNCPLCTANEYACIVSEQCIPIDRRCDGVVDCTDATDEATCDICGHGFFHCAKSGECVSIDLRCDGRRQCPHGEDEMLCKKADLEKKYTCHSQDAQIPLSQVCDGVPQCPDQSDEYGCDLPLPDESSVKTMSSYSVQTQKGINTMPAQPQPPPSQPQIQPRPSAPRPSAPRPSAPIRPIPPPPAPETETVEATPEEAPEDEEEEEYEVNEETTDAGAPSFPMLSLSLPKALVRPSVVRAAPASTTRATTTPVPATRSFTVTRKAVNFGQNVQKTTVTRKKEITQTSATTPRSLFLVTHKIVQPTYVEVTAPPATSRKMISTKATTERPNPMQQTFHKITATGRTIPSNLKMSRPYSANSATTVAQAPTVDFKTNIMQQLGSQLQTGLSPELMSKIEKIITDEVSNDAIESEPEPENARKNY